MGWVSARVWCVGLAGASLFACGPTTSEGDTGADSGGTSVGETGMDSSMATVANTGMDTGMDTGPDPGPAQTDQVDVLFVIDNSGSMGEEQGLLADAAVQLVAELAGANLSLHIGFTTTDNGNPWCDGTTPEAGQLVMSSCRSRQSEFVFQGATLFDALAIACLDICETDQINVTPTVGPDGGSAPRPWIQIVDGEVNTDVDFGEAIRCLLPQGITGCGFEQPLESMYKAILRSQNADESGFGFFRPGAIPVVIIVSDEVDCSFNNDHVTIFLPDGDRTFWSLPAEGAPTSAVCWNAGVACEGSDCMSANYDALGNDTNPDDAVMMPVSRYTGILQELEGAAAAVSPGADVIVELIGGVTANGAVMYQPTTDQLFMDDFGIGPGCTSDNGKAVPPVRMREVAEAMAIGGAAPLRSICDASYDGTVSAISARVLAELGL